MLVTTMGEESCCIRYRCVSDVSATADELELKTNNRPNILVKYYTNTLTVLHAVFKLRNGRGCHCRPFLR